MTEELELVNRDVNALLEDPIAILLGLVEKGEVDPWNVDIVDVTDKYLSELERRRELNLRVSGRAIFMASVLLRIKAEQLDEPEADEDDDFEEEGDFFQGDSDPFSEVDNGFALGPIELLEREIERRLKRKDQRKRMTNIYELIKQLRRAEKIERRRQRRQKFIDSEDELFAEPDAEDVVSIAHEENYEEMAGEVYKILSGHPDRKDPGVSLYELSSVLHVPIYMVYLPCLFLVQDGFVDLEQDEVFGDLWVVVIEDLNEGKPILS